MSTDCMGGDGMRNEKSEFEFALPDMSANKISHTQNNSMQIASHSTSQLQMQYLERLIWISP